MNTFKNIEIVNFIPSNNPLLELCENTAMIVRSRTHDTVQFTSLAIELFIAGAKRFEKGVLISSSHVVTLAKLFECGLDMAKESLNSASIEVESSDIMVIKEYLELEMKHMETLRDNRDDNYDADKYISARYLLLDLREWLMGEIVGPVPIEAISQEEHCAEYMNVGKPGFHGSDD